jgi:endonuclease YncB( thermonuclease family)
MIRLGNPDDFVPSDTYNEYNFIAYRNNCFQYLKNSSYEINTLEELYDGPHLEEKDFDRPFVSLTSPTAGGGGAVRVTSVSSIADGDTASFVSAAYSGSTRYFYINTPEVNGGTVTHEPWGYVASKFNKQYMLLNWAQSEIYVQSIIGYSLTETYGRHLALVWINNYLSQFLIVREGLTEGVSITYSNYDLEMTYKNIPYLTFLKFAEKRAKTNGWGVWGYPNNPDGEKAPDWNWNSNTSTGNTNPIWTPHFELPW